MMTPKDPLLAIPTDADAVTGFCNCDAVAAAVLLMDWPDAICAAVTVTKPEQIIFPPGTSVLPTCGVH